MLGVVQSKKFDQNTAYLQQSKVDRPNHLTDQNIRFFALSRDVLHSRVSRSVVEIFKFLLFSKKIPEFIENCTPKVLK